MIEADCKSEDLDSIKNDQLSSTNKADKVVDYFSETDPRQEVLILNQSQISLGEFDETQSKKEKQPSKKK